jgi:aminoglycoside phosphotransferase
VDLDSYEWTPWWANPEAESTTHRLTRAGAPTLFVKQGPDLDAEHERLLWCAGRLPVPEVVSFEPGRLVTVALRGQGAHDRGHEPDTARAASALAEAWRLVHDLPVDECPFDTTTDTLLARSAVDVDFEVWDVDEQRMRPAGDVLDELLATRPTTADLVVVHGDASVPNALIEDGVLTGIVDVGHLGVGDRWWDLSACLASMSREDNALGHERDAFLAAYGVAPDPERERWFRLLYRLQWDRRITT